MSRNLVILSPSINRTKVEENQSSNPHTEQDSRETIHSEVSHTFTVLPCLSQNLFAYEELFEKIVNIFN
jgi:hypothetical protein